VSGRGESVNGWSADDVERLVRRTGAPRGRVEAFCRAVDKHLFMLLNERQRRATLHFHLGAGAFGDTAGESGLPPAPRPHIE
jgi:hypothetical protein